MTEEELFECVRDAAKRFGWKLWRQRDSRRSEPDLPDCILVREKVKWRELKSLRGRLTDGQAAALDLLRRAGQDADVWTPADWPERIVEELR